MNLLPTIATVSFFVSIGYVILRAYWKGSTHGLNGELFD